MNVDDLKVLNRNKTLNEILHLKEGVCLCKDVRKTHLVSTVKAHLINGETVSLYIYFCDVCKKCYGLPADEFEKARTLASPSLVTTFMEHNISLSESRRALDSL